MPQNVEAKIDWLTGQILARRTWLQTHGAGTKRPWPEHEIEAKEHGLEMLEDIRNDYQLSLDRARGAA